MAARTLQEARNLARIRASGEEHALTAADVRLQDALADGTLRLLSCSWLRRQPEGFVIPRHQDLLLESPTALLSPSEAAQAFGAADRRVGVLSYGWITRSHPDPRGDRAQHVLRFLQSEAGCRFEGLFWDFECLPEPDMNGNISDADQARQSAAFNHMHELYGSPSCSAVIRLTLMPPPRASASYNLRPVDERGWCVFEVYVAMIVVGTEAHGSHHTPKLLDATGGEVPELVAAPTPEEFAARLDAATFTVEADVGRAKQLYLDYYLENGVGGRARLALEDQRRAADGRRRRLRGRLLAFGVPTVLVGGVLILLSRLVGEVQDDAASNIFSTSGHMVVVCGAIACLLAVNPDERRAIRALVCVTCATAVLSAVAIAAGLVDTTRLCEGSRVSTSTASGRPVVTPRAVHCMDVGVESAVALCELSLAAYLVPACMGRLPPRAALGRMYFGARVMCFSGSMAALAYYLARGALEAGYVSSVPFAGSVVTQGWILLASILASPSNRRLVRAWLGHLADPTARVEREQSAIAALVGGGSEAATVDAAAASFRLLPFEAMREESELPGSGTGPADAAALRERTFAAALGAAHSVFVSHSWHDPREAKWAALRAWARRYGAEHGAPPLLWLDAACVAQDSSTDRSLALLPLYIAGCQRMVVLAGSTFIERLWCVIEIFCFLRMGGHLDRITVVPVHATEAGEDEDTKERGSVSVKRKFAHFDVARARCAVEEDTQKLLACVEVGFGSYEPFNKLVRQTFKERVDDRRFSLERSVNQSGKRRRRVGFMRSSTPALPRASALPVPHPLSNGLSNEGLSAAEASFSHHAERSRSVRIATGHARV